MSSAFTIGDLQMLVSENSELSRYQHRLDWTGSSDEIAHRIVETLAMEGAISGELFTLLETERPGRIADIQSIRTCFSSSALNSDSGSEQQNNHSFLSTRSIAVIVMLGCSVLLAILFMSRGGTSPMALKTAVERLSNAKPGDANYVDAKTELETGPVEWSGNVTSISLQSALVIQEDRGWEVHVYPKDNSDLARYKNEMIDFRGNAKVFDAGGRTIINVFSATVALAQKK